MTRKVLFLSRYASLRGAIEEILTSLSAELPATGFEAEVYGRSLFGESPGFADGTRRYRTPLPRPGWFANRGGLRDLIRTCAQRHIDIVHAHGTYRAGYAARLIKRAVGLPYVVTSHGDVHVASARMRKRSFRNVCRSVLRDADAVTHLAPFMAEYSYELCDVSDKSVVIPNGVDFGWWDKPVGAAGEGFVFALGRLMEYKGFSVLIEAMRILADQDVKLSLVLAGQGEFEPNLRAQAGRLGLEVCQDVSDLPAARPGAVCFPGFVAGQAKRAMFDRCLLVAFPSQPNAPESFGVVQIEAMAAGKALVASDIPATRAILTHGKNAELAPPADARLWAQAIRRVACDDDLRLRYEQANRVEAKRYDWPVIAAQYANVYRRILGDGD